MLTDLLSKPARSNPGKAAIVQGDRRISYGELWDLTARCGNRLRDLGVNAGDCVAVVLPNCPEFVVSLFACARVHAVMLPLNPRSAREELHRLLVDAGAKVIVTDEWHEAECQGLAEGAKVVCAEDLAACDAPPFLAENFEGPALYLYTSGSTGSYKRVCCTQKNLYFEAHNFVETMGLTAADNILCTIPLFHSYGIGNCVLDAVYAGSTLVLLDPLAEGGFATDAPFVSRCRRVADLIRKEKVRFYPGIPYQFGVLATAPDVGENDLAGLKLCVSSGDVLPRETVRNFLDRFGLRIRSLYGSTEAGSISIDSDPAETMESGSLGLPLKNVSISIRDETGRDLPDNTDGQIWVLSPGIPPRGYDGRQDLNAQVFCDGYYNTGDLGRIDARGRLILAGRKQSFVDVAGYKVDLGEVEEILQSHPKVLEAAAVGVDVPRLGTLLKAAVVSRGPCLESELLAHCRLRLAAYKVPRRIEFRETLPRSAVGKVLRSQLADGAPLLENLAPLSRPIARSIAGKSRVQQIEWLAAHVQQQAAATLQKPVESIARSASFHDLEFDSLGAAELHYRLTELTGLRLSITMLWNYPTIDQFAEALLARLEPGRLHEDAHGGTRR